MKKISILLMSLVMLVMALITGCSKETKSASSKTYDIQAVYDAVEKVNPLTDARELDDFALENDFKLNMADVKAYKGKMSGTLSDSALILVVEATEGKGSDIKKSLETYKENQKIYFGNYPEFADAQAMVNDGRIIAKGDYVVIVFANVKGATYNDIDAALSETMN